VRERDRGEDADDGEPSPAEPDLHVFAGGTNAKVLG
jgi:hypothetical protein